MSIKSDNENDNIDKNYSNNEYIKVYKSLDFFELIELTKIKKLLYDICNNSQNKEFDLNIDDKNKIFLCDRFIQYKKFKEIDEKLNKSKSKMDKYQSDKLKEML